MAEATVEFNHVIPLQQDTQQIFMVVLMAKAQQETDGGLCDEIPPREMARLGITCKNNQVANLIEPLPTNYSMAFKIFVSSL